MGCQQFGLKKKKKFYTHDSSQLRQVLESELNWEEEMSFSAVSAHLAPTVLRMCEERGAVTMDSPFSEVYLLEDPSKLADPPPEATDIQVWARS